MFFHPRPNLFPLFLGRLGHANVEEGIFWEKAGRKQNNSTFFPRIRFHYKKKESKKERREERTREREKTLVPKFIPRENPDFPPLGPTFLHFLLPPKKRRITREE